MRYARRPLITPLEKLLRDNVVQVLFIKRTNGMPRNMLCTTNRELLNSQMGLRYLGFTPPKGGPRYDAHAVNNIIVWDIHKRAFRTICCDDVVVERVMTVKKFLE